MKTCSSCKQEKPVEEFYNSKVYKGGLGYRCKACNAIKLLGCFKTAKITYRQPLNT